LKEIHGRDQKKTKREEEKKKKLLVTGPLLSYKVVLLIELRIMRRKDIRKGWFKKNNTGDRGGTGK